MLSCCPTTYLPPTRLQAQRYVEADRCTATEQTQSPATGEGRDEEGQDADDDSLARRALPLSDGLSCWREKTTEAACLACPAADAPAADDDPASSPPAKCDADAGRSYRRPFLQGTPLDDTMVAAAAAADGDLHDNKVEQKEDDDR